MLAVVSEADRVGALHDLAHHVEAGPDEGAALAGQEVAIAVVGEAGGERAGRTRRDAGDGMHMDRVVGVVADVRLVGDVADGVIGDGLGDVERQAGIADDRLGQPVEAVVGERVRRAGDRIHPLGQVAQGVEGEGEVLDRVAGAGLDGRDAAQQRRGVIISQRKSTLTLLPLGREQTPAITSTAKWRANLSQFGLHLSDKRIGHTSSHLKQDAVVLNGRSRRGELLFEAIDHRGMGR